MINQSLKSYRNEKLLYTYFRMGALILNNILKWVTLMLKNEIYKMRLGRHSKIEAKMGETCIVAEEDYIKRRIEKRILP